MTEEPTMATVEEASQRFGDMYYIVTLKNKDEKENWKKKKSKKLKKTKKKKTLKEKLQTGTQMTTGTEGI